MATSKSLAAVFLLILVVPGCFWWRSDATVAEGDVLYRVKLQWSNVSLPTWRSGEDPCLNGWENITCRAGNVVGLNVSNRGIYGKLPEDIGGLQFLELLDISNAAEDQFANLSQNVFSAPLPDSLGQLTNLKILNMSMMTWNIPFPATVGKLINLVEFRMAEANMTGGLPPEMFGFGSLRVLHLGGNSLNNTLASFTQLTRLRELSLYDIKFQTTVPASLGNLTDLINLSLHDCGMWGALPEFLSRFKDLGRLHLYGNTFTGRIPDSWASLQNLKNFRADGNFLYGPFPRWLLTLPYLSMLRLDENYLYGEIPTKDELSRFSTLRLECNLMNGTDPFPFQQLGNPVQTSKNCFTGAPQDSLNDAINNCKKGAQGFAVSCSELYADYIPNGLCPACPKNQYPVLPVDKNNPCVCQVGPAPKVKSGGKSVPVGAVVGGVLALFVVFSVVLGYVLWKRRDHFAFLDIFKVPKEQDFGDWEIPAGVEQFTLQELGRITDNFNDKYVIGAGGFGKVFFGTLGDGRNVAIKRAGANSMQGTAEFRNEVTLLSRLHHRHLVRLEGFCDEEGLQILVYEYMSNGNLHSHLLGKITSTPLSWYKRLEIAVGVAQALEYLHSFADPPVIHRDVKPSNVLLDDNMVAKLADFGISKATAEFDTHVSTRPAGTAGYLDPEYFLRRQLTTGSDVYAFGVVLLELITGQEAIDHKRHEEYNLIEWTKKRFKTSGIRGIIDPLIEYEYSREAYTSMTELALLCTAFNKDERPAMKAVLSSLEPHLAIETLYRRPKTLNPTAFDPRRPPPETSQRSIRGAHITWDSEHTDSSVPTETMDSAREVLRPR